MIEKVAELNRILLVMRSLTLDEEGLDRKYIIRECQRFAIEGRMPAHSASIDFALKTGLIEATEGNKVALNENGKAFLNFNPEELYDLTETQKKYLLRRCFFDGVFQKALKEFLKCFEQSDKRGTFTWSFVDGRPFGSSQWILPPLEQLGLIWRKQDVLIIRKEFASTVAEFVSEPKGWTEEQYFEYMKEKKELGDLAEDLVWEWEIERLKNLGHPVEAHCVKKISKLDVGAGYDLKSFNGSSKGMRFDRFIEVKGSKGPGIRFFWSENEIKTAEELGEKYWIYYQGGVSTKTGRSEFQPILYQNPLISLKEDSRLTFKNNGAIVEGKVPANRL